MSNRDLIRIGELSKRAGVSVRALRYYEEIGLLHPAARTESGYRLYDEQALYLLSTIKRMKLLGLSLDAVMELRGLYEDQGNCASVRQRFLAMLDEQVRRIDERVAELLELRRDLLVHSEHCRERAGEPEELEERCQSTLKSHRIVPKEGAMQDADQGDRSWWPHQVSLLRG